MLIHWGNEAGDDLPLETADAQTLVSEILRARRMGKHLIVIEPQVLRILKELPLSAMDLSLVERLRDEFTQTGRAIKTIRPAINIVNTWEDQIHLDAGIVNVPLRVLLSSSILEAPILVLENQKRDGFLYGLALDSKRKHPITYNTSHGGGGDTPDVFEKEMAAKKVTVCAVDSDKYTPHTKKNEKLSAIITRKRRVNWPLGFPISPNCREIENLIPPEVVFKLQSAASHPNIQQIKNICGSESPVPAEIFWNFFDIKKGVVHGKARKLSGAEATWLSEKLQIAGITIPLEATPEMGDDPDEYVHLNGFGEKVVDQVMRSRDLTHEVSKSLSGERWDATFKESIEEMLAIFSSLEPIST